MEERNQRPDEASNLPTITLAVLVLLIVSLLYVGYGYFSDDAVAAPKQILTEAEKIADGEVSGEATDGTKPQKEELTTKVEEEPKEEEKAKKAEDTPKETKKSVAEIPENGMVIPHMVQSGETFFGIANRYNLKSEVLQALNPDVDPQTLKVGVTRLKVKIKAKHTVGPGDILSVVAKKYDITKKTLMYANKLTKDYAKRGDELIIPLK
jgi:LysM repeat protein